MIILHCGSRIIAFAILVSGLAVSSAFAQRTPATAKPNLERGVVVAANAQQGLPAIEGFPYEFPDMGPDWTC